MRVVMKNRLCTDEHLLNTNLIYLFTILKTSPLNEFRFYRKTCLAKSVLLLLKLESTMTLVLSPVQYSR